MDVKQIVFLALWIIFPVCGVLAWLFIYQAKHKERMLMIEKGLQPNADKKSQVTLVNVLKTVGIVAIGIAASLGIISIMVAMGARMANGAAPVAIIFFCIGASLLIANRSISRGNS